MAALLHEYGAGEGWGGDGSTHALRLYCHPCQTTHLIGLRNVEQTVYALQLQVQDAAGWRDDSATADGLPDECLLFAAVLDENVTRFVAARETGTLPPTPPRPGPRRPVNLRKMSAVLLTSQMIDEAESRRPVLPPGQWVSGRTAPVSVGTCPTCQGPSRETTDLVCQTCGRDYGAGIPAGAELDAERRGTWVVQACPECRSGKHDNCSVQVLDEADHWVGCPCSVCGRANRS